MIEGIYGPPGGASLRGAVYAWSLESARRGAELPAWLPDVDGDSVEAFDDGPPATGSLADNVVGGDVGSVTGASFDTYTSADFGSVPANIVLGDE
jgi:hypothetical protein